jgi:L-proline amide hydrolase
MPAATEGRLEWAAGATWYSVVGDLDGAPGPAPLVVLHGGPGAAHDYCQPIADLIAQTGRAVVLYDQLGCGRSQHLPQAPVEFWTPGCSRTNCWP